MNHYGFDNQPILTGLTDKAVGARLSSHLRVVRCPAVTVIDLQATVRICRIWIMRPGRFYQGEETWLTESGAVACRPPGPGSG